METSYLLMLLMVSAAVAGQQSRQVIALSQSSIKLIADFDQVNVKDLSWIFKNQQDYYRIIKIQNGQVVENLNNRYEPTHNGTVLGIDNVTKSDSGNYKAVNTMWNNVMKEDNIDLTVYDPVPTPKIESEVERIGDQCYVSLKCSIPSNTDVFFYNWKYRYHDSEYQNINETVNTVRIPLDHQDTEFMCKVQNPADHKNATVHVKYCSEMKSNTTSIAIGVVLPVVALVVAAFWVWRFKFSYRSSNTSEQDDQDKGQEEEDENKTKEHKRKDEHQNEDNLTHPVPEIGIHRVWTTGKKENEVKKHKTEDEHWNKDENREIDFQDTSDWDDIVRNDAVEEHEKKNDDKDDEGSSLLEKTDVTTALKTRSMDTKQS
ncbi:CD48 antigen-like [Ranitomeya imitator]|uniref:CD48 antigen-like n=1 Tax=Ranitomeya imitator TaxID=111125 RepID=UPI0037E8B341